MRHPRRERIKSSQGALREAQQAIQRLRSDALGKMSDLVTEVDQLREEVAGKSSELEGCREKLLHAEQKAALCESECEPEKAVEYLSTRLKAKSKSTQFYERV